MKLTVKERIGLESIIPYTGNLNQQILVKSILGKTILTQQEKMMIEWRRERNGMVTFNGDRDFELDIDFSAEELQLLKDQVRLLDEQKSITQDNLEICIKINSLK
jgi:hypothetical protein